MTQNKQLKNDEKKSYIKLLIIESEIIQKDKIALPYSLQILFDDFEEQEIKSINNPIQIFQSPSNEFIYYFNINNSQKLINQHILKINCYIESLFFIQKSIASVIIPIISSQNYILKQWYYLTNNGEIILKILIDIEVNFKDRPKILLDNPTYMQKITSNGIVEIIHSPTYKNSINDVLLRKNNDLFLDNYYINNKSIYNNNFFDDNKKNRNALSQSNINIKTNIYNNINNISNNSNANSMLFDNNNYTNTHLGTSTYFISFNSNSVGNSNHYKIHNKESNYSNSNNNKSTSILMNNFPNNINNNISNNNSNISFINLSEKDCESSTIYNNDNAVFEISNIEVSSEGKSNNDLKESSSGFLEEKLNNIQKKIINKEKLIEIFEKNNNRKINIIDNKKKDFFKKNQFLNEECLNYNNELRLIEKNKQAYETKQLNLDETLFCLKNNQSRQYLIKDIDIFEKQYISSINDIFITNNNDNLLLEKKMNKLYTNQKKTKLIDSKVNTLQNNIKSSSKKIELMEFSPRYSHTNKKSPSDKKDNNNSNKSNLIGKNYNKNLKNKFKEYLKLNINRYIENSISLNDINKGGKLINNHSLNKYIAYNNTSKGNLNKYIININNNTHSTNNNLLFNDKVFNTNSIIKKYTVKRNNKKIKTLNIKKNKIFEVIDNNNKKKNKSKLNRNLYQNKDNNLRLNNNSFNQNNLNLKLKKKNDNIIPERMLSNQNNLIKAVNSTNSITKSNDYRKTNESIINNNIIKKSDKSFNNSIINNNLYNINCYQSKSKTNRNTNSFINNINNINNNNLSFGYKNKDLISSSSQKTVNHYKKNSNYNNNKKFTSLHKNYCIMDCISNNINSNIDINYTSNNINNNSKNNISKNSTNYYITKTNYSKKEPFTKITKNHIQLKYYNEEGGSNFFYNNIVSNNFGYSTKDINIMRYKKYSIGNNYKKYSCINSIKNTDDNAKYNYTNENINQNNLNTNITTVKKMKNKKIFSDNTAIKSSSGTKKKIVNNIVKRNDNIKGKMNEKEKLKHKKIACDGIICLIRNKSPFGGIRNYKNNTIKINNK